MWYPSEALKRYYTLQHFEEGASVYTNLASQYKRVWARVEGKQGVSSYANKIKKNKISRKIRSKIWKTSKSKARES